MLKEHDTSAKRPGEGNPAPRDQQGAVLVSQGPASADIADSGETMMPFRCMRWQYHIYPSKICSHVVPPKRETCARNIIMALLGLKTNEFDPEAPEACWASVFGALPYIFIYLFIFRGYLPKGL